MTILPMLDYGYIIYKLAGKGALKRLDVLFGHQIFHQCSLWNTSLSSTFLYTRRKTHWLMLIYKTLFGLTPPYLRYLLQPSSSTYNSRSARSPKHTHSWVACLFSSLQPTCWPLQFYLNLFIQRLNHGHSY
jgi:hypothetical protein